MTTVDLPLSAHKITIDLSDCISFDALHSTLDRLSLGGLEFLEVIEKLRLFARRPVSIRVNFLEDMLITHFFLSVILVGLCVILFFLISSSNFCICLFFVKSKDFLYKFSWIFPTIFPFNLFNYLNWSNYSTCSYP